MRTSIKYPALAAIAAGTQIHALAGAIDLHLKMPQYLLDMLGGDAAVFAGKMFGADGAALTRSAPTQERFKSFLAQKYATSSDNPILTDVSAQFAEFFHSNMPEMDMGWTPLFDFLDLRGSTHDHFDLIDTNAGITYEQLKPGEAIKKRTKITESKTTVGYLTMGAGLGLLDDWLAFQQWWKVDEAVAEFGAKHWDKMAELHYGVFTGQSTAIDVNFATDDATTFNAAVAAILRAVRSSGYAVGQNAGFYIVTSPEKVGRITRMLSAERGSPMVDFGTMKEPIAYTVKGVIASTYVSSSDTGYYLVLPGRKIKRAVWKDLTVEGQRNAAVRAQDLFAHAQYNCVIGDTAQVRRVKFA